MVISGGSLTMKPPLSRLKHKTTVTAVVDLLNATLIELGAVNMK